jgi:Terminase small subunit
MTVLSSSKHERFAQLVAKGVSATEAYVSAGYSKSNAQSNASRLSANELVLARIKQLKTVVAERVITAEVRRRSWRIQILQSRIDAMLALSEARAIEYADHSGGSTGLLVKDYRGKDANQEVWKFDAALESKIMEALKQAAIEEGQWTEKREIKDAGAAERKARINRGRDRLAAEKKAAEARGEVWR